MFAKPINLILVYILTVFNIAILSSPLIAILVPFFASKHPALQFNDDILSKLKLALFFLMFLVSFFMLFYMMLDFLFGLAMHSSLKGCKPYQKLKDYNFLDKIFSDVKYKFDEKNVKLYIKNSNEINAYAVGSIGRKAIVLTAGLINCYLNKSENAQQFSSAIRSVLSHEMSHLINRDFLPTYLIIANKKATNTAANIVYIGFKFMSKAVIWMPLGGRFLSHMMIKTHNLLYFFVKIFNKLIVYNMYEFLRRFISRSIEYRCDKQAAEAFGGKNMAFALSYLGESGYFTLFSTHPGTKRRINKVINVEAIDGFVRPKFIDTISNSFALMFLVVICIFFANQAKLDILLHQYIRNHEIIHRKLGLLWHLINRIF